jgi:dienelactone hydrolase
MKARKSSALTLLGVGWIIIIAGCSGGGGGGMQPPLNVTVSVVQDTSSVQAGGTAHITATVVGDPTNKGVTWTVSCSPAPCGSASPTTTASGIATAYTAPSTPPASDLTVTITATSLANASVSNFATVTVLGTAVTVTANPTTVPISTTSQITATVTNDPTNMGVIWTVSCSPGPCGSVSPTATASGVATTYSTPTTFPAGDLAVTITATSAANMSVSNSVTVTVPGTTISIMQDLSSVQARGTAHITATVVNDPTNKGVTWTVSCSPAPCGSASPTTTASGIATTFTAPSTPPASDLTVTITATSVFNTQVSNFTTVTVLPVTVSVSPTSALIPVNATTVLNATPFTAMVGNDPGNKGVSWTLTQGTMACSAAVCGAISPASTPSGTATNYAAPSSVPASATVTLTATSITDASKAASATFTLAVGTVKLVPARLNFHTVRVGASSNPQTTTLTNAGGTTLNITDISSTGTHPGDFLQTQTCIPSVAIGSSCVITVTFKPTAAGSRSADISITDDSAGSPQQVSVSGSGCVIIRSNKCVTAASLTPAIQSALAGQRTATVPRPVGPSIIGTRVMELVDPTRDDPYVANGAKRDLLVRFWYPASIDEGCKPAEYTTPRIWNYFSHLVGVSLPRVKTNSCLDAPITEGAHPVIVFTHGYTGTFTDYTFLFEDLASRGYVVASVNHTYEATAVDFPDGRFVKSVLGSHLGKTVRNDEQALSFAVSVRLSDLKFIMNELERLNASAESPFGGQLDMSRVAVAGHSLGGLTALLDLEQEPRLRASVIIDAAVPDSLFNPINKPVLMLAAGAERWSDDECRLWDELRGPRFAVNLRASEHVTPSDAVWLVKGVIKTGPAGPEKTIGAIRDYVAAFLDVNLRGKPSDPLLTGPSADYPYADVITQTQSLCGEVPNDLQR